MEHYVILHNQVPRYVHIPGLARREERPKVVEQRLCIREGDVTCDSHSFVLDLDVLAARVKCVAFQLLFLFFCFTWGDSQDQVPPHHVLHSVSICLSQRPQHPMQPVLGQHASLVSTIPVQRASTYLLSPQVVFL